MQSFVEGRRMAESSGDTDSAAACDMNIASLYSEMGEVDAAAQWTQRLLEGLSAPGRRAYEPKVLILLATLRARQQRMEEAEALFAKGIAAADRAGDLALYANAWNRLGEERLKRHSLLAAEAPLLEAYRIRKLNRLPLDSSYRNLGLLRLEQGDLTAASVLLDRTVELAVRPQATLPAWDAFHHRGRLRLAQGHFREAMDDLRIAVRLARDWRWSAPPDDAARIGAEGWLEKVHSALIEAGNRLYLETHDPALLRETFEAAEENRASSLRALLATRRDTESAKLPAAYWEALGRLQTAEVQAIRSGDAHAVETVAATRAELTRMEAALGPAAAPLPAALLDRTRGALGPGTALLSFHLADRISWMWALDQDGLVLHRLPPRREIEAQVRAAADASGPGARSAGPSTTNTSDVGSRPPRCHPGPLQRNRLPQGASRARSPCRTRTSASTP